MKVLIIGSGAREHILALSLKRHPDVHIYNIGSHVNPGIRDLASDIQIFPFDDFSNIERYVQEQNFDFAWIGPEAPLEMGVSDLLWRLEVPTIGPTKALAQLETSKGFTRALQKKYQLPGALEFKFFKNMNGVEQYLSFLGDDYVVKADGLMGGKGVKLSGEHLASQQEAFIYCQEILDQGQAFVIEEKLVGSEFSLLCFCDGKTLVPMPIAHDHKRAFNNDLGPNTGGMGVYTDADGLLPFVSQADVAEAVVISEQSIQALQTELQDRYVGIVYGSFMATAKGVRLIEFNARFGDPEVINLLSLLETDVVEISMAMIDQRLDQMNIRFKAQASVCKYVVPEGYPDAPIKGQMVHISKIIPEIQCFYASVVQEGNALKLLGSRALALVALADTICEAGRKVETAMALIEGPVFHRSDIGDKNLINQRIDHINKVAMRTFPKL